MSNIHCKDCGAMLGTAHSEHCAKGYVVLLEQELRSKTVQCAELVIALGRHDDAYQAGYEVGYRSGVVSTLPKGESTPAPDELPGMRERFEQFMLQSRNNKGFKSREKLLQRLEGGDYAQDHTQRHWWTWQCAFAALSAAKEQA